jgi:Uma2 family endonuclease
VSVVDKTLWDSNPSAYTALREPIQLVVEVMSTNWEDDYIDKLDEYQRLGITEYWIVDYLAIGSREYLGNPKEPSVFIYRLDESGQYQLTRFQGADRIVSPTFPELVLTVEKILEAQCHNSVAQRFWNLNLFGTCVRETINLTNRHPTQ